MKSIATEKSIARLSWCSEMLRRDAAQRQRMEYSQFARNRGTFEIPSFPNIPPANNRQVDLISDWHCVTLWLNVPSNKVY